MEDCVFCQIVCGTIKTNILYSDDDIIAFKDLNPQAPTHVLLIPKMHIECLDACNAQQQLLLGKLLLATAKLAAICGLSQEGYRVINNCGVQGGQTVPHLHIHLLGGRKMNWPPG